MMQSMGVTEFMHQLSFETFFGRLFRLEANIIHYNSALKAFEGNSWEAALALLEDLPQRMLEASLGKHMGVEPKIGVFTRPPEIIPFVHRIFHYFHHPFWRVSPYFWIDTHMLINISWIILHALGVKLTLSLILVGRRICWSKFQTSTAWAALDLMSHLWVSNRFCTKLPNTRCHHKVEMLQNHKFHILKDINRTLQYEVDLIAARFLLPSWISCLDS